MENGSPEQFAAVDRSRHWPLFLAGVLLSLIGPAIYVVQFRAKNLAAPWYVPILASAGAAFMIASVWRRRGVARMILLVLFTFFCGFEWFALLVATKSPAYTGPAQPGREVPRFTATRADGTPFTEKDLEKGTTTVLVFYRGRW
jgi:hypothetical protein